MLTTGRAGLFMLWTLINSYHCTGLLPVGMRLCIISLSTLFTYFRMKYFVDFAFDSLLLDEVYSVLFSP